MNKSSKGYRIEYKARKLLESLGYLVDRKNKAYMQSPDLFTLFDLVAVKGSTTRFIQVKSNPAHASTAKKEIKEWKKQHNLKILTDVWLYLGSNKWRIYEIIDESVLISDYPPPTPF